MKAIVFEEHGDVDKLQYKDVPEPKIGPNEALIKIKAAGCNYNDIWARKGLPGMEIIMPHVSGSDAAGEVVEVGSEVKSVKVGDEVMVITIPSAHVYAVGDSIYLEFPESAVVIWHASAKAIIAAIHSD